MVQISGTSDTDKLALFSQATLDCDKSALPDRNCIRLFFCQTLRHSALSARLPAHGFPWNL